MANKTTKKKPLCVSIGPFGKDDLEISFRNDLEIILRKVCLEKGYDYKPFAEIPNVVMASDIFSMLINADLVIADLRDLNPNVMYELGIRHAFNKPALHLINKDAKKPWDIDKNFILEYPLPIQVSHQANLEESLIKKISQIETLKSKKDAVYNTFISSVKEVATIEGLTSPSEIKDVLNTLMEKVNRLSIMSEQDSNSGATTTWASLGYTGGGIPSSWHGYDSTSSDNLKCGLCGKNLALLEFVTHGGFCRKCAPAADGSKS